MNLKMTDAQKTLYYIAENMKMEKKISDEGYEHFQQAIKALEQQPSEDCVSRKAVFETIDDCNSDGLKGIFCSYDDGERFKEYVKMLPPVTPIQRWIPVSENGEICNGKI